MSDTEKSWTQKDKEDFQTGMSKPRTFNDYKENLMTGLGLNKRPNAVPAGNKPKKEGYE